MADTPTAPNPEPAREPVLCRVGPCPRCGNFVTGVLAVGEPWPKHYERTVAQGCSHHGGAHPIAEELLDPAPPGWRAGDPPWTPAAASATTADDKPVLVGTNTHYFHGTGETCDGILGTRDGGRCGEPRDAERHVAHAAWVAEHFPERGATADDSSDLRTWNVPDEVLHSAAFQMAGNVAHHLLDTEIERLKASGDFRRTVEVAWMNGVRAALAAREVGVTKLRVPEHIRGDGPCADCGTVDNIVWSTDDVLWNEVCRRDDEDLPGIVCIPCFAARVNACGLRPTGWRLLPDWHWETHEERAARRGTS